MTERAGLSSTLLRASVWEWAQVSLLIVNLTWTTLCLGGFRPETMILTSALNGALVAVHFLARVFDRTECGEADADRGSWLGFHPAGWLLLPFLAYAAINARWISPVPWLGWIDWLRWMQLIAVFWVVLNGVRTVEARTILLWALMALGAIAVVLACYQRFVRPEWLMLGRTQSPYFVGRASGPFGIPNSLAALLLLLIPPAIGLALRRKAGAVARVFWSYLAVVFAIGLALTVSRGAWLSLALALAAWPLFGMRGRPTRRFGVTLAVLVAAAAVMAVLVTKVPLVRQRAVALIDDAGERSRPILWRGAWRIFQEHPLAGGGAGSFNVLFEPHRPGQFQDEPLWAHNEYLNTLSDYGGVGFVLFFGAWAAIAGFCARSRKTAGNRSKFAGPPIDDPMVTQALMTGAAAFALQSLVDFHFKIPSLALTFAAVAALAVRRAWPDETVCRWRARWEHDVSIVAATFAVAAAIWFANPAYRAEGLRYAARQAIDGLALRQPTAVELKTTLAAVRGVLVEAVGIGPANGAAWSDLSYAIALEAGLEPARTGELGREAERAADRALALSRLVPEFWVRRAVALDLQGRHVEAGAPLARALQLAPANARVWYYQAFHLSLRKNETGRALAAVDFALRLDPGNAQAQALRQRLIDRGRAP